MMFDSPSTIGWAAGLLWLAAIAAAGFLVSWVLTDRMGVRRGPYIAALAAITGGLAAGYLLSADAGAGFWTDAWAWGVAGALVGGGLLAVGVARAPVLERSGVPRAGSYLWESVVYGATEGLLLSVLPVVATWQALSDVGWTDGWRALPAGTVALVASAGVIMVHHLGYRGYRSRRMVFPVLACSVLSLAYLLTASPIAPMGGHIILHLAMQRRRAELPPHEQPAQPAVPDLPEARLAPV